MSAPSPTDTRATEFIGKVTVVCRDWKSLRRSLAARADLDNRDCQNIHYETPTGPGPCCGSERAAVPSLGAETCQCIRVI